MNLIPRCRRGIPGQWAEGRKLQQQHADSGMNESVSVSLPESNQMIRFNLLTAVVRRSSWNGARFMWLHFPLGGVYASTVWEDCGTFSPVGDSSVYFLREKLYLQFDEAFLAGSNVSIRPVKLFCHLNDFCHGEHFLFFFSDLHPHCVLGVSTRS